MNMCIYKYICCTMQHVPPPMSPNARCRSLFRDFGDGDCDTFTKDSQFARIRLAMCWFNCMGSSSLATLLSSPSGREPESPKSPQSLYKSWGLHYTVKDTKLGYLCLNCNRSHMDIGVFKLENCPAGLAWKKAKPEATSLLAPRKLEAAMPCVTVDAEIAAALQLEQEELERLNTLQALMEEQQNLEGLLAQMEARVQAKESDLLRGPEIPPGCYLSHMVKCCVHVCIVDSLCGSGCFGILSS